MSGASGQGQQGQEKEGDEAGHGGCLREKRAEGDCSEAWGRCGRSVPISSERAQNRDWDQHATQLVCKDAFTQQTAASTLPPAARRPAPP